MVAALSVYSIAAPKTGVIFYWVSDKVPIRLNRSRLDNHQSIPLHSGLQKQPPQFQVPQLIAFRV